MCADRTTETISHFIGLFELKAEEARLRDAYDEFELQRKAAELKALKEKPLELKATLELPDPTETTIRTPQSVPQKTTSGVVPAPTLPSTSPVSQPPATTQDPGGLRDAASGASPNVFQLLPALALPGSVVTLVVQTAYLADNDVLGLGAFRDIAGHVQDLDFLAQLAQALHAPGLPAATLVPTVDAAQSLGVAMAEFTGEAPAGFSVFTTRDAELSKATLNGAATEPDLIPHWRDVLPAHHQDAPEEQDALPEAWALPAGYARDTDAPEGHSLITGGNLLVNDAAIQVSWIDAPLFAVAGAWKTFDIVSQVALSSDNDTGDAAAGFAGDNTEILQSIEFETTGRIAPWLSGNGNDMSASVEIVVDQIKGDLVVSNSVQQLIELLDNDMFSMAITGANALYALGDNTVFNVTEILQAGFAYDMILVMGDMIEVNTIHQTAILLDDDRIEGMPAPSSLPVTGLATQVGTARDGAALAGDGTVGPDEAVGVATETPAATDTGATQDDGNVILNMARLSKTGIDSAAELSDSIREMLTDASGDIDGLREKLMNDPAFAGLEQARVLKIDGDLIQSNTIKQIILASDRDDVLLSNAPSGLALTSEANALLNAATIASMGVDSTIMAQQGAYSELLIHQASLTETGTPPEADAQQSDLVSEAVAFLMEDTQNEALSKLGGEIAPAEMPADDTSYDGLAVLTG